ncbi:MAG TPA: glycosyltransferase [Candidatus Poseidoniales archaeon]|nr:MAG TPA: glycosyltransferase [Candidatus Poseidoniales archaeon]HII27846.1 glycosyltransferase family 4 protein [Poseidonia sp.]
MPTTSLKSTLRLADGGLDIQILVVSLLYPVPLNPTRGVFVEDHVDLLKTQGHDVKVVNPLPRMPRYAEARRSTLMGVAKAPRRWTHNGTSILAPRFFALPDHPYPRLTASSVTRRARWVEKHLGSWRPDVIVCHTLWPVANLAKELAQRWKRPWVGVVHGYDFDVGLDLDGVSEQVRSAATSCDVLVCASQRLSDVAQGWSNKSAETIPCVTEIDRDWRRPVRPMKKPWKKEPIDVLFPADPRRPEKRHLLALQTGEVLEERGWMVGITTLRHQPRDIVYDRMLTADVTLITSRREAGPLVARESLLCGTPVVSVNVGEVDRYLPKEWVHEDDPEALADGIEDALRNGWQGEETVDERLAFASFDTVSQAWTELLSSLVS